jgi:hypothetical protein
MHVASGGAAVTASGQAWAERDELALPSDSPKGRRFEPDLRARRNSVQSVHRCSLILITTTPGIEDRTVTEYLGVVTAQGVLEVNVFKDVGAGMRNIFGGRSKSYENELASGVSDALAETEKQAASGTAVKLG